MSTQTRILAAMPGTAAELCTKTGLSRSQVQRKLKALHGAGLAHTARWEHIAYRPTAVHAAGPSSDVPPAKVAQVARVPDCMVPRALGGVWA
jgi:DNA-binding IclR family transcriptional regulator